MPDWKTLIRQRLAPLHLSAPAESNLTEEVAQNLEDRFRELCDSGEPDDEAYQRVVSELEHNYPLARQLEKIQRMPTRDPVPPGDAHSGNPLGGICRDIRYALRSMRQNPIFVLFVVVTLALGIGANTTVFTMIDTLILNPLPVRNAGELAAVAAVEVNRTAKSGVLSALSYPDLRDYAARNEVFGSLAGFTAPRIITLQDAGAAEPAFAELATSNYFFTLGLTPAKGRFFLPEEDSNPGGHAVAVLNYGTWQARFGSRGDIIGHTVRLNNMTFTVVGVAPRRFIGVNAIFGPDLWIPASMAEAVLPTEMQRALTDRGKAAFTIVGRLKPGVTRERAEANLMSIASALAVEYPAVHEQRTVTVRPIGDVMFGSSTGGSAPMRFASAVLLIVVGIVLLIACSNVANLLMARSAVRQQEMAVRLAMGASRSRLVQQLLTESVLLGILSGACGLFVGYGGLQILFGMLPATANFPTPRFDATVFLFALFISLATGFLFGGMPAIKASRANVADTLKLEARTSGRSRKRVTTTNALVVAQVAFSFLLLVTAALFLRSIQRAYQMDPGFQTAHLAIFMSNPGQAGFDRTRAQAFYKSARDRVRTLPGVASAAWASNLPLWARPVNGLEVEGRQKRTRSDKVSAIVTTVGQDYFDTAGVRLESGREFTPHDLEASTPVAIVNRKLAQDYWPGGALGKRIQLPGEKQTREIVGIARTANYSTWGEAPQACVYVPLEQSYSDAMTLFVRSKGDPRDVIVPVEREVRAAAPEILVSSSRTGSELVDGGLFQARMGVGLLTVFGLLALGLASIGLYGIVAYSVNQRRREIGLRMALGATQSGVLGMVLKEGMSLVGTGVLIGFGASLAAGRVLRGMLYGVQAGDPLSVGAAAVMLSAVALLACYLPAYSATRVDPVTALREA